MTVAWQTQPIILASGSATRHAMLTAAGIRFDVIVRSVDEGAITQDMVAERAPPAAIATALAVAKAQAVSLENPGHWVLGGDSVVSANGRMFDKPRSRDEAAAHLRAFCDGLVDLNSAAALVRDGQVMDQIVDTAQLHVRAFSDDFLAAYLDAEWPAIASCVGCFRIEGLGVHLFDRVDGNHFTILGMPLLLVLTMLRRHGVLAA